jgi:predicted component of type VI protein secretion system
MSAPGSSIAKNDLLGQIWSICTTFTEEAMATASKKCKEAGFDTSRGVVPLDESFINLSSARGVLEDAIEKQKLVQLPITVQKEIAANLESISKSLQGLTNGSDEVVNLTNSIEALNTSIWKYGLHNLSDQVLGHEKKLNQLKNQELQITRALAALEPARRAAESAETAAGEAEQGKTEVLGTLAQIKETATAVTALLDQIKDAGDKTNAIFSTVQQHEKQSGELTASIRTANNDLTSLDASIRKFYGEVDDYRKRINQTSDDARGLITTSEASFRKLLDETTAKVDTAVETLNKTLKSTVAEQVSKVDAHISETNESVSKVTVAAKSDLAKLLDDVDARMQEKLRELDSASSKLVANTQETVASLAKQFDQSSKETIQANQFKTESLIAELAKLKEQIHEQLQQATGFTLFGAFQARQNQIARAKNLWAIAIGVLVLISAGVTIWIAHEAQFYNVNSFAFYVKLSLTVPLAFAITFCTVQYGRERRLEEEYAFKSSISVSLNPYRDLIQTILQKDEKADLGKYTDFVIESVKNVFTPPTDKVFDTEKRPGLTEKTLKQALEVFGTAARAVKPQPGTRCLLMQNAGPSLVSRNPRRGGPELLLTPPCPEMRYGLSSRI